MTARALAFAGAALLTALSFRLAAAPAPVTDYALDPPRSAIKFAFEQAGAQNQGRFRKFAAALRFDDARLPESKLDVAIETGSLDTGDEERDQILRGSDLLDVASFPRAQFKAGKITRVSGGRYQAAGKLTIRDVTREVLVPFTFRLATEKGVMVGYMTGRVTINRLDFGVGQGEWKATDQVANEVDVNFSLRFTSATAK